MADPPSERRPAREQADVLPEKDDVIENDRGLQQWSDEAIPEGDGIGTGGSGTAARAARIASRQRAAEDAAER